jgi:DNA ligase (NAD+)
MHTLQQLNSKLDEARKAYYAGTPIMSDAEYDVLEQQLAGMAKTLGVTTSVLSTVGTDVEGRIPHLRPMRSMANVYSIEELIAWATNLGWPELTVGKKRDGISGSLIYDNGVLIQALTRGDGDAGESILPQVKATRSIPQGIEAPGIVEVRGELVIRQSTMERINVDLVAAGGKPYVSTRNLVAGTMKLKDLDEVTRREVQFIPWEVTGTQLLPDSANALLDFASRMEWGFQRCPVRIAKTPATLRQAITDGLEDIKADTEIASDGLVIKVNSRKLREQLGVGTKFANYQVAFKAQNARAESILRSVEWQVGRLGKLTPVATIDPVMLAGAQVTHATLNNFTWIQEMGLKIGSRVMVVRSGDVIPQIAEVLEG